ncbi:MAG: hypothetical protein ACRBM6_19115 [Geminicoccales bacterium]
MRMHFMALGTLMAITAPVAADEVEDSMRLALEAYQQGDVLGAKEEIDFVALLLAQQQAGALSEVLPSAFDGWSREESDDNMSLAAGMFGGGLFAGATYERGGETVELNVVADSPALTAMASLFTSSAVAGSMGKLKRINGHKAIAKPDGELQAMIANRFLVQVSGTASVEDKEAYFAAIDFDTLEAF